MIMIVKMFKQQANSAITVYLSSIIFELTKVNINLHTKCDYCLFHLLLFVVTYLSNYLSLNGILLI